MLARLVQFGLSQRLFVVLAAALLAGAGWYSFRNLPSDAFPDVSSTQVKIIMKASGMTPEEIDSRIAIPIDMTVNMERHLSEALTSRLCTAMKLIAARCIDQHEQRRTRTARVSHGNAGGDVEQAFAAR